MPLRAPLSFRAQNMGEGTREEGAAEGDDFALSSSLEGGFVGMCMCQHTENGGLGPLDTAWGLVCV